MTNAEVILNALDVRLDSTVELTLYGRAALHLGFPNPHTEFAESRDIDSVFSVGQAEELAEQGNFWEAVDQINEELKDQELYISHFFQEDQVILTPAWKQQRQVIAGPWRNLRLFRLGNKDLLLSKLMRNDPLDQSDARFIVQRSGMSIESIRELIQSARIPVIPELQEEFAKASQALIESLS